MKKVEGYPIVKPFEFSMLGESAVHNPSYKIRRILREEFPEHLEVPDLPDDQTKDVRERFNTMCEKVTGEAYDNYFLPSGAKITKQLRGILSRECGIPKQVLESKWATVCRRVSELYLPKIELVGSLDMNKEILGEGILENSTTCFGHRGENYRHKRFLMNYNRVRMLAIFQKDNPEKRGRCIVYFPGGRKIYLTNFYFRGLPQNWRLFVDALKVRLHLNGTRDVAFGHLGDTEQVALPIWKNGDAAYIEGGRGFTYTRERQFPCPWCGEKTNESDCGGSIPRCDNSRCPGDDQEPEYDGYCERCDEGLYDDDMYFANDCVYCESCYDEYYTSCDHCNETTYRDDLVTVRGRNNNEYLYCPHCAENHTFSCDDCGDLFDHDYHQYFCTHDGTYCEDCKPEENEDDEEDAA